MKIIIPFLISTLLWNNLLLSSCTEGCLACERDSQNNPVCLLCDHFNFYRPSRTGSCFKYAIENCEIPSIDMEHQACHLCNPGFFLDNIGMKCSRVPKKHRIPSCSRYHWQYSCLECETGNYLFQNKCLPVASTIENCRVYVDAKTCLECEAGHFLHKATKQCEPILQKSGCLVYSSTKCSACSSGFFKKENIYAGLSLASPLLQNWTMYSINGLKNQETSKIAAFFDTNSISRCVPGSVDNCSKHSTFNVCAQCAKGFFVSPQGKCVSDPVRMVANCQAYKRANTCSRCNHGFYLKNNVCLKLTEVSGCLEFDVETEDCVACDQDKFYLDEGFCGVREKSSNVSFCAELSSTSDHCIRCLPSFRLTDDMSKCLPHIPHCMEYVSNSDASHEDHTNIHTVELKCVSCDEHFYLSPNKKDCIPQNLEGCLEYTASRNECDVCASGYFKSGSQCQVYTKQFCKTFEENSDACKTCFDGFFKSGDQCMKYNAMNCLTFEEESDNCKTCLAQYYLVDSGSPPKKNCQMLTARNCKDFKKSGQQVFNECDSCFPGYAKVNGNCEVVSLMNCAVQTDQANECQICKTGYYKEMGLCKPYTVKNCGTYNETANECVDCLYNFGAKDKRNVFFKNSKGDCQAYTVSNCATKMDDENKCETCLDEINWFIDPQGDCTSVHVKHCQELQAKNSNKCKTCANGFEEKNGRCVKVNIAGCVLYSEENCQTCAEGFYKHQNKCFPHSASNCKTYHETKDECNQCLDGFTKNGTNCDFFYVKHCESYDSSGDCVICSNGYYLHQGACSPQDIDHCLEFKKNENFCEHCLVGFTTTDGSACTSIPALKGCMTLNPNDTSKCVSCFRGFKMNASNSTCELIAEISNCILYESNTGRCEACAVGMVLDEFKMSCSAPAYSVSNCIKYEYENGQCVECAFGFYLMGENAPKCVPQNVENCLTYKINENVCVQCTKEYKLEDGNCFAYEDIEHCLHYNSDRSKCEVCDTEYYPEGNKCERNLIGRCMLKVRNKNKCYACEEHYSLGFVGDCEGEVHSPTDPNCHTYSEETETCEICKVGFYLNNFLCEAYTLPTTDYQLDPSCEGTLTNTSKCQLCPEGNISFPLNIFKLDPTDYSGCQTVDPSTGECTQCLPDHDSLDANKKTCQSSGTSSLCKQLISEPGVGTTIDTAEKCAECRDRSTYYLDNGTCTIKKETNVILLSDDGQTPEFCTEDALLITRNDFFVFECGTVNTITGAKLVTDCLEFDFDTEKCLRCKYNYKLNAGETACEVQTQTVSNAMNIKLDAADLFEVGDYSETPTNLNAAMVVEVSEGTDAFLPAICDENSTHIRVISLSTPEAQNFDIATVADLGTFNTKNFSFASSFPTFSCEPPGTKFLSDSTSNPNIESSLSDCAYWAKDGGDYLKCMGCVSPLFPVFTQTTHRVDGAANEAYVSSDIKFDSIIVACVPLATRTQAGSYFSVSNLLKQYQGLNYHTRGSLTLANFLQFDSNTPLGFPIIVFAKQVDETLIPNYNLLDFGSSSGEANFIVGFNSSSFSPNYIFDASASTDATNLSGGIPNCQIHVWKDQGGDLEPGATISSQITSADTAGTRLDCVSCMPGTTGFATGDKYQGTLSIPSCLNILNCDTTTSTTNTWMNACQICDSSFGWEVTADYEVMFHRCIQGIGMSKCRMYGPDATNGHKCLMCETGYTLTQVGGGMLACILTRPSFEGCNTLGRSRVILGKSSKYPKDNALIFNYFINSVYASKKYDFCEECSSGSYLIKREIGSDATLFCTNSFDLQVTMSLITLTTGCEYYVNSYTACASCVDDGSTVRKIVDPTNTCVNKPNTLSTADRVGCRKMDASSLCTDCKDGYKSISTASAGLFCYTDEEMANDMNCSTLDSTGKCTVCMQGYVFDSTLDYNCMAYSSGNCNRLNRDGSCYSCVTANHYPIHYKLATPIMDMIYGFSCVDQGSAEWEDYLYTSTVFDFTLNTYTFVDSKYPEDEFVLKNPTKTIWETFTGKAYRDMCVKVITAPFENCAVASQHGFKCSKCKIGYSLIEVDDNHNECHPIFRACLELYPNGVECKICLPEYKKDPATRECIERNPVPSEFVYDSDVCKGNITSDYSCDYCPDGNKAIDIKYYMSAKDFTLCLESDPDTGNCIACGLNADYASGSACSLTSGTKCRMLDYPFTTAKTMDTDSCLSCNPGYSREFNSTDDLYECIDERKWFNTEIVAEDINGAKEVLKCYDWASFQTSSPIRSIFECAFYNSSTYNGVKSNCVAYSDDESCALCDEGMTWNSTDEDCETILVESIPGENPPTKPNTPSFTQFDSNLELTSIASSLDSDIVILGYQREIGTFSAVQCKNSNRMKVMSKLDPTATNLQKRQPYSPRMHDSSETEDKTGLEITRSYPHYVCYAYVSGTTKFFVGPTDNGIAETVRESPTTPAATDCAYWGLRYSGHKCLRCLDGFIPLLVPASRSVIYNTTGNSDTHYLVVSNATSYFLGGLIQSCSLAANVAQNSQRIYEGLSYGKLDVYPAGAYVSADNCSGTDEALVIIGQWRERGMYDQIFYSTDFTHATFGTHNFITNHLCIDITSLEFFTSPQSIASKYEVGVSNCQINAHEVAYDSTGVPDVNKFSSAPNFKCISCRPGYSGTYDADEKFIETCTLIPECDQGSANNIWMNACGKCKSNFAWTFDSTNKIINLHECVAKDDTENCQVVDQAKNNFCVLCKTGYILKSDGKCLDQAVAAKRGCTNITNAFPYHTMDVDTSETTNNNNQMRTLDFLSYQYLTQSWTFKPECATCDSDMIMTKITTSYSNFCSVSPHYLSWTADNTIPKCVRYDPSDNTKCVLCEPDYVVVTGSDSSAVGTTCVDMLGASTNDPFLHACQAVKDDTDFECVKCKMNNTYVSRSGGGSKNYACYNISDITPMKCAKFNYTSEECLVCEENHIFDTTVNNKWCTPQTPTNDWDCSMPATNGRCLKCKGAQYYPFHWIPKIKDNDNDYIHYCLDQGRALNDEYFHIIRGFSVRSSFPFIDTSLIPTGNHFEKPADYTDYSTPANFTAFTNLADLTEFCMNIKDGTNFTDCEELSGEGYLCSKCSGKKALYRRPKDFNTCFDGCAATDPISNQCLKCSDDSKFLDPLLGNCDSSYTSNVDNCNYKSPYADLCIFCNAGFYLNSSGVCVEYTSQPNCVHRERFSDKCRICVDGYTLTNERECVLHNTENCEFTNPESWSECEVCSPGFELSHGKCHRNSPLSNLCKTRGSDGKCASCYRGYSLSHGSCTQIYKPEKIDGCLTYGIYGHFCEACFDDLTLSNGRCIGKELANCETPNSDGSHCLVCEEGYFLNGVDCQIRRNASCKKFANNFDKCLDCANGSFLYEGRCMGYTVRNCQVWNPKKDECLTCRDGFHLDFNTMKCRESSMSHCQVKNYQQNTCFYCLPEFYLSNEGNCLPRTTQNCAQFDPFADSCIDCIEGYFLVTDNGDYVESSPNQLNSCKPYSMNNCAKYHPQEDKCLMCFEGQYLTASGTCLPRTAFNCKTWNTKQNQCASCEKGLFLADGVCTPYSVTNCLIFEEMENGCVSCQKGFYLSGKDCVSYSISDCQEFHNNQNKCVACDDGFFNRNGMCEKITQNNCSTYAQDENACSSCKKGFYLQSGVCLTYTISCMDYSSSKNECISCPSGQYLESRNKKCINYTATNCASFSESSDACETCVDNHYFSGGQCLPYTVTNCRVYHSLFDECITCQEGFFHSTTKCLPYNVSNCAKFSPVSDICLACRENHYNFNGNCLPYQLDNCKSFDMYQNSCHACESKMFYRVEVQANVFFCKRVTDVDDCEEYEPHSDKCHMCAPNYYLDESMNTCHEVPNSVAFCEEYFDNETCKACVSPYYLHNNECHKSEHLISQCIRYQANSKCQECEESSMLSDDSTLCLKITESSCKTYLDPSNCKSCEGNLVIGYIDDSNGSVVSGLNGEDLWALRAICHDSGISNCQSARKSHPKNICLMCEPDHFLLDEFTCSAVTDRIDNCEIYFSDGVCSECANNHLLSQDKKECLYDTSFLGQHCQEGKFLNEPSCFMCQPGFYFDSNNNCVPCLMDGCSICSSDRSASCRVCKDGYYMNGTLQCVKNGTLSRQASTLEEDQVQETEGLSGSSSIWMILLMWSFSFLLR